MRIINTLLRALFDGLLYPFRGLPPIVGLALVAVGSGVIALVAYKHTSNQAAITRVKARIAAALFEVRLYNDDLRALLRAQAELLRSNARYFGLNLVPMAVMMVPFVLIVAQLQFHYGFDGLHPGDRAVLTARWSQPLAFGAERVELEAPAGVAVETPGVVARPRREISWRLRALERGEHRLVLEVGGQRITKTLVVDQRVRRRSPARLRGTLVNQLLYPAEPPLPAGSGLDEIRLAYPDREVSAGLFRAHWLVVFLLLTIVAAFALKKPLGVTL